MKPTRLTLGTAQLGMPYGIANAAGQLSVTEVERILDAAVEHGILSFDTAPAYGDAEQRIGAWRRTRTARELMVTTKIGRLRPDLSHKEVAAEVRISVESSRARLGAERLDVVLLHAAADLTRFGASLVDALGACVNAGWVGAIGISTLGPEEVDAALAEPTFAAVQVPLNLLDRRVVAGGQLAALAKRGLTVFARSPLLQGLFALRTDRLPLRVAHTRLWLERLIAVGDEYGVSPVEVALAWSASQRGVSSVVVGTERVDQIVENARAVDAALPRGLDEALSALGPVPLEVIDPTRWPT